MKILVTGGAGFIGSALVRRLADTGDHEVTVLDALTYAGSLDRLAPLVDEGRVRFVHGDITDPAAVDAALAGLEAVAHLAAETHVDRSLLDADPFHRTNALGTEVLCAAAVRHGIQRFLHVSTDEVYGPVLEGAADEGAPLRPTSPYARSKAESDRIALAHHAEHGLPVVVTRSANQYGPWQFPEKLIPFFVATIARGDRAPLYGDGLHRRDWLHVDDGCAALELVLRHGEPGEVYNVSAHDERANRDVALAIAAHLGRGPDAVEHVADRTDHDRRYAVDTRKIEALGPLPTRPFEPALAETVDWYLAHRAWWEPLLARVRNR